MNANARETEIALDSTQQVLFDELVQRGVAGQSLLEIGCGSGGLHQELLRAGASEAVGIELMTDIVKKAEARSHSLGLSDRASYISGDFMEYKGTLESADIVILDKVVHCYHDPQSLIRESAAKAKTLLAVAFPAPRPLLAASMRILSPILRLFLPFRVKFTKPEQIRAWIRETGFERSFSQHTEMWHIEIYQRSTTPEEML